MMLSAALLGCPPVFANLPYGGDGQEEVANVTRSPIRPNGAQVPHRTLLKIVNGGVGEIFELLIGHIRPYSCRRTPRISCQRGSISPGRARQLHPLVRRHHSD